MTDLAVLLELWDSAVSWHLTALSHIICQLRMTRRLDFRCKLRPLYQLPFSIMATSQSSIQLTLLGPNQGGGGEYALREYVFRGGLLRRDQIR